MTDSQRSLTPHFPTYEDARHFIQILNGIPKQDFFNMRSDIMSQRGDPQHQMNWSDPDEWIRNRLEGKSLQLATKIWDESGKTLSPRYVRGEWLLSQNHHLLDTKRNNILQITSRGHEFIQKPEGDIVAEIDQYEGVFTALQLVAELGPGKRSIFLPEFSQFCYNATKYRSETAVKTALYDRLMNLIDRNLVSRNAQSYEITDEGLEWLENHAGYLSGRKERNQIAEIERLAKNYREKARLELADFLFNMNPFEFEKLVKFLLEEMGYVDVEVTSPVHDKGVDVLAKIELGISSVREVIQVKRHRSNLGRPILDLLRGSLHRFDAVRGTIITTSGFSKGAVEAAHERGAAPITLIDGDRLLDLLIDNSIGVKHHEVNYFSFDPEKLADFESELDEES
jgi:restriction system protein